MIVVMHCQGLFLLRKCVDVTAGGREKPLPGGKRKRRLRKEPPKGLT
jgi:hypothetical protein